MGWHLITGPVAGCWVASQINGTFHAGSEAIGQVHDGHLVAGALYENWNGRSIIAHIAVRGRMTPAFLAAIFDYPFNVAGVQKVICPIPSDNARSVKLASKMGFTLEATITDATPTGDILLFTLPKANCKFLGNRYGKKCSRRARSA